jgi:hypothetical protein
VGDSIDNEQGILFRNSDDSYTNRIYKKNIAAVDTTLNSSSLVFSGVNGSNSDSNLLTDYMSLSSVGNLGVGINTPAYKVDVAGDINFTGTLRSNGTAFTVAEPVGQVVFGSGTGIDSTTTLFWDNTNSRLGVNKATPAYTLDIDGNVNFTGLIR